MTHRKKNDLIYKDSTVDSLSLSHSVCVCLSVCVSLVPLSFKFYFIFKGIIFFYPAVLSGSVLLDF